MFRFRFRAEGLEFRPGFGALVLPPKPPDPCTHRTKRIHKHYNHGITVDDTNPV